MSGELEDWWLDFALSFAEDDEEEDRYFPSEEPVEVHEVQPVRRTVACKKCGRRGLEWKETMCGWKLHGEKGELHRCGR